MNTTEDLRNRILHDYPQMTNSSLDRLLELYPNDPRIGCPYGTGDGILPTGHLDKESNSIYGCVLCQMARR